MECAFTPLLLKVGQTHRSFQKPFRPLTTRFIAPALTSMYFCVICKLLCLANCWTSRKEPPIGMQKGLGTNARGSFLLYRLFSNNGFPISF
jgi:hypothetical protein